MTGMHGLRGRITAVAAAVATLASGLAFAAPADAETPTGKGAGTIRVGADPANCDHVGDVGSSGVNGTSRWSLGRDGTLTIEAGTLASGCAYVSVAVDANGKKKGNTNVKKINITGQVTAGADSSYLFAWMGNAAEFDGLEKLNTGSVTNMDDMFEEDPALASLDVSKFDTSNVTAMNSMFYGDVALASLDVSKWDTSKVTAMESMFGIDEALASLDVSKWDTSSVTAMGGMFDNDWALASLDVSKWDTSSVTAMGGMFNDDLALASLDVSNWDTSKVTIMNAMFAGDQALASLDVSHFDTSNVTEMDDMFADDRALASLDVSKWDTSKVTAMGGMFYNDRALASLDVSHFDTSKVTDMDSMFLDDWALASLDVSHFDTSKVTDMGGMFLDDWALASLDLSNWDTSSVTKMGSMFADAGLHKVKFGSNFRFIGDNGAAGFPEAGTDGSGRYTGKWVNVGSGTENDPKGSNVWDAGQLMASYDGSKDADTYVWQPKAVASAGVTVRYVDEQGRSVHADQLIKGDVGASYDASTPVYRLDVRGYTLDESKLPTNAKGVLGDKMVTVVYTYKKDPVASAGVTVRYVDEQGRSVHADQLIKGDVGASYDASTPVYRLDVRGYTLDASKLPANAKGVLSDKMQTVVYTYKKDPVASPGVTVRYVDEQGNRVHADRSITGNVGASYDASTPVYRLDVRGYTLDASKLPANAKGVLGDKPVTVTYTYRKAVAPAPAPNNNGGNANANAGGNRDSGGSGSLATTGASVALASLGGVLLLAAGVALLWRRRRA